MPFPNTFAWFWRFFLTFHFVVLARILFKAEGLDLAWEYFSNLWGNEYPINTFKCDIRFYLFVFVGFFLHFSPESWEKKVQEIFKSFPVIAQATLAALCAALCYWGILNFGAPTEPVYYSF